MKKFYYLFFLLIIIVTVGYSSNISYRKMPVISEMTGGHRYITLSVEWEQSWRSPITKNWDAAWVFIKYQCDNREFKHLYLDTAFTPTVGSYFSGDTCSFSYGLTDGKAVGVFIYRRDYGQGNNDWRDIKLRCDIPNSLDVTAPAGSRLDDCPLNKLKIHTFAVETVYIPEGAFYLGSGGTESGHFRRTEADLPYFVQSEDPITVGAAGTANGLMSATADFGIANSNAMGPQGTIAAEFPKGFQSFYCFKYEISQGAYRAFLNTLTYPQQASRIVNVVAAVTPASAAHSFVMRFGDANDRNNIKIQTPGVASATPAKFICDIDNDNAEIYEQEGQFLACALRPEDLMAYLDFSGFRPMTEFEYEKTCRGSAVPVPNEYAWGNTSSIVGDAIIATSRNFPFEEPSNVNANILFHATAATHKALLTRNGVFATETSTRTKAGAAYYGVTEMSGNVYELVVDVADGRGYVGIEGNGMLDATGNNDVTGWIVPTSFGLRGGAVNENPTGTTHRISDRALANWNTATKRSWNVGGRGVRTVNASTIVHK